MIAASKKAAARILARKSKTLSKKDRKKLRRAGILPPQDNNRRPRPNYFDYINSKAWKKRRVRYYRKYGKYCDICGSTVGIQLHHRTYIRLGSEADADLQALCRGCHENTHEGSKSWIADPITQEYLDICRNF